MRDIEALTGREGTARSAKLGLLAGFCLCLCGACECDTFVGSGRFDGLSPMMLFRSTVPPCPQERGPARGEAPTVAGVFTAPEEPTSPSPSSCGEDIAGCLDCVGHPDWRAHRLDRGGPASTFRGDRASTPRRCDARKVY